MYNIGEYVRYKSGTICCVKEIKKMKFAGMDERMYYVLSAVNDEKSVNYVPVDCKEIDKKVKRLLTAEEIDEIISETEGMHGEWVEDSRERAVKFEEILGAGDRAKILWVLKTLAIYKKELEVQKRKMYASDARILSTAERMIKEEFAFVLGIDKEEVAGYIKGKIERAGAGK